MLGIEENKLYFEVLPTKNPKYLAILDLSDYMELPKQPNIRITLPGYSKPIILPFKKDSINKYNSNSLRPNSNSFELNDLPDGIYKISYHIYPHQEEYMEIYHLRTSIFNQKYTEFLLSLENSDCSLKNDTQIKNNIIEADLAIQTSQAHLEEGNIKTCEQHYRNAINLLEKLTKKLKGCY